ncbi:alanine--tRNA ligase [Buchnera aphidicola (Nipponaphis monzeni)]|uniref:Alanine--tRNA ligase n=1 Tax=Buchnera aphidicola (Nipponaphis monzeni) TaxID=2495405 RepID=A0A455TAJ8_9GAMM|nr:alanine--tRNA ligase [Buchnera aphidicola]BBI01320.1 alanine--tRNA ligase [Buchnera aphidicola (Nipponaphis monzeni)]
MKKTTNEIRDMFLNFFVQKKHKIVQGSSLIPANDSTLLFTNAGMNQFKNIFLGKTTTDTLRIVTSQNCLRTGGKHNDLDNVGKTPYHHTFFEMLGNFSFGDYFKKKSIIYAWELLTSSKWFNLDKSKLIVTVHNNDDETYKLWLNLIKIPQHAIIKIGKSKNFENDCDNFWQMGQTGPCGPSTEIFFNPNHNINDTKKLITSEIITSEFIEIWNIVFIQFNRIQNKSLIPLTNLSVDTGMGLERIASVIQKVNSNYEIDLFQILIQKILSLTNINNPNIKSVRIISDHIRSSAFIILENVLPSNEKRGYVLRKIIRRAAQHGLKLNINKPFLYKLIPSLIQSMGHYATTLKINQNKIQNIIKTEEINFSNTLEKGLKQLQLNIKNIKNGTLNGKKIFYLHDTFGFPIDLVQDICQEKNIKTDIVGFKKEMKKQKKRSTSHNNFIIHDNNYFVTNYHSIFKGYTLKEISGNVQAIYKNQKLSNKLICGELGIIVLDQTSLYGESGGQVGDNGILYNQDVHFKVINSKKYINTIYHEGKLIKGEILIHDKLISKANLNRRLLIQSNHTATHLLHAALKKILGPHIVQKGSFIDDTRLRFDFSYNQPILLETLYKIETLVNYKIQQNIPVYTQEMSLNEALEKKIISLFYEKYKETNTVRVVSISNFSHELCGGTHTFNSGEIGLFKINPKLNKISSGIYRVEANTGLFALKKIQEQEQQLNTIASLLKTNIIHLKKNVQMLINHTNTLKNKILTIEKENNFKLLNKLQKKIIFIKKTKALIYVLKDKDIKSIRNLTNELKNKLKLSIIVLISTNNKNFSIIANCTKELSKKIQAIKLVNLLIKNNQGKGGGTVEKAEGGGEGIIKNINKFLIKIKLWIQSKL